MIAELGLRGILDSRGQPTVEAEVVLADGRRGRASSPAAIAPGQRERPHSRIDRLGPLGGHAVDALRVELLGARFDNQGALDACLAGLPVAGSLGAGVTAAISIAFLRATAGDGGEVAAIAALAGTRPAVPRVLVNIWSGGIHDPAGSLPYQQVMFAPDTGSFAEDLAAALAVYAEVERGAGALGPIVLSASSGMILPGRTLTELLDRLADAIGRVTPHDRAGIGIDAAAEHRLAADGTYRFGGEHVDGARALAQYRAFLAAYPISYLEDPFAPDHVDLWRELCATLAPRTRLFGDDLFATDATRVDPELAGGVVIKVSQCGTLSGALAAATNARTHRMAICVSHRSGETEDPFICDLAVGLAADYLKIGGPRRCDRTARYNQLVRLAERWDRTRVAHDGDRT
jgi:enolase